MKAVVLSDEEWCVILQTLGQAIDLIFDPYSSAPDIVEKMKAILSSQPSHPVN